MQIFYMVVLSLIPLSMIFLGIIWKRRPPRKINQCFGYRTINSMQSVAAWNKAHRYVSKWLLYLGGALFIFSMIVFFIIKNTSEETLAIWILFLTIFQLLTLLFPIITTERYLTRNFPQQKM